MKVSPFTIVEWNNTEWLNHIVPEWMKHVASSIANKKLIYCNLNMHESRLTSIKIKTWVTENTIQDYEIVTLSDWNITKDIIVHTDTSVLYEWLTMPVDKIIWLIKWSENSWDYLVYINDDNMYAVNKLWHHFWWLTNGLCRMIWSWTGPSLITSRVLKMCTYVYWFDWHLNLVIIDQYWKIIKLKGCDSIVGVWIYNDEIYYVWSHWNTNVYFTEIGVQRKWIDNKVSIFPFQKWFSLDSTELLERNICTT